MPTKEKTRKKAKAATKRLKTGPATMTKALRPGDRLPISLSLGISRSSSRSGPSSPANRLNPPTGIALMV